jgi:hypothetical protein
MMKLTKEETNKLHVYNIMQFNNAVSDMNLETWILRNPLQYDTIKFNEQLRFIEQNFYKTSGSSSKYLLMAWMREVNEDPVKTNETEVHNSIRAKFAADLISIIKQKCVYLVPVVSGQRYFPDSKDQIVTINYKRFANLYIPPSRVVARGVHPQMRPTLWQEYLDRLMPQDKLCWFTDDNKIKQQDYFEKWIAQRLQTPAAANTVAVLLRGNQGTGKNYWSDKIMKSLVGETNYKAISLSDTKGFTASLYNSTLVHIEEINDTKAKTTQRLKPLITQEEMWVEEKFQPKRKAQKYFGLVLSSNFPDPVKIEQHDRRYFVAHFSEHQQSEKETKQFFVKLTHWCNSENGYQEMFNWLHSVDISEIDFRQTPMTTEKDELAEVQTSADGNIEKASIELTGRFKDACFSLTDVQDYWKLSQPSAKIALANAGFISKKRRWQKGLNPSWRYVHKDRFEGVGESISMFDNRLARKVSEGYVNGDYQPELHPKGFEIDADGNKWTNVIEKEKWPVT